MRWLAIGRRASSASALSPLVSIACALAFAGCDATFQYTEPTDTGEADSGDTGPVSCVTACALRGLFCDVDTGICEHCILDGDCPEDKPRCQANIHQCVRCSEHYDCVGDEVCIDHHCVEPCTGLGGPGECKLGTHCDPKQAICVQCPDPLHGFPCMPPRVMCATSYGRCEECLGNGDCRDPDRRHCQLARHNCVECLHDSDCLDATRPHCTTDYRCAP